jgi:hypothetical protein
MSQPPALPPLTAVEARDRLAVELPPAEAADLAARLRAQLGAEALAQGHGGAGRGITIVWVVEVPATGPTHSCRRQPAFAAATPPGATDITRRSHLPDGTALRDRRGRRHAPSAAVNWRPSAPTRHPPAAGRRQAASCPSRVA